VANSGSATVSKIRRTAG